MIQYLVYVVDDEESIREGISMALEEDYEIESFYSAESALKAFESHCPDLVLLDIGLPGMSGMEALERIKGRHSDVIVIMITAYEDIETVISAMKLGAYDYVVKPIHMDSLEVTIHNAVQTIRLRKEVQALQEKYLTENLPCFIAESNAIQDVMEFIGMVAKSPDTPILIIGETGTGKELIGSAIHYRSPNFKGPFMTVNCAAIPKELIESELFGYEEGAFSGARKSGKRGLIEEAENGTLFLDEVGDLSLEAQAKLLRFLEKGEFYKVGSTEKLRVRTRVISATNKDLDHMIEKEIFRRDLYYRLGVIKVKIPSLDERRDDIIPIAKHFLLEFSNKYEKGFLSISRDAEKALLAYKWKGHVRELKNMIERGVLVGKGPELTVRDLGLENGYPQDETAKALPGQTEFPPIPEGGLHLASAQEALEKHYFKEALRLAGDNESKAARLLHMNHHTFRYRKKRLHIK